MSKSVAGPCRKALAALAVLAAFGTAHAAKKDYLIVNESAPSFALDAKTMEAIWKEDFFPQLQKLYPPNKYGFFALVDGGIDPSGKCVVTARATMMPRAGKVLQVKSVRSAVVFDAVMGTTREKCTELAKAKLDQAIEGMLAGIVAQK